MTNKVYANGRPYRAKFWTKFSIFLSRDDVTNSDSVMPSKGRTLAILSFFFFLCFKMCKIEWIMISMNGNIKDIIFHTSIIFIYPVLGILKKTNYSKVCFDFIDGTVSDSSLIRITNSTGCECQGSAIYEIKTNLPLKR